MLKPICIIHTAVLALIIFAAPFSPALGEQYEDKGVTHSWFSFNKPKKDSPADQMKYAQGLLKDNKTKKAAKAFRALVVTWPGSSEASLAQWAYAKVLDARGDQIKAFNAYQFLMDNYTGRFPHYDKALTRQFEIATNIMAKKRGGFLFFDGFEAPERAVPYLEKVIKNGPRSSFAAQAQYLIGEAYENSFDYQLAVVAYITALHRYPLSPLAEKAAFGRARVLNIISESYPNDQEALDEAWAGIMVFLRAYPASSFSEEAIAIRDALLDRKATQAFNIAQFYDKKEKKPEAALKSYELFLEQFPNSRWTDEARKRIVKLSNRINAQKEPADEQN